MVAVCGKFDIFQRTIYISTQVQKDRGKNAPIQRPPLKRRVFDQQMLKFVGMLLVLVNSGFGIKELGSGWPFVCYPTFSWRIREPKAETITPYGVVNDKEELISLNMLKGRMSYSRFSGMARRIIAILDQEQRKVKLKALVLVMKKQGFDLSQYSKIRIYRTVYSTQPGKVGDPPILREFLEEIDI
jgi:hypothetical protein